MPASFESRRRRRPDGEARCAAPALATRTPRALRSARGRVAEERWSLGRAWPTAYSNRSHNVPRPWATNRSSHRRSRSGSRAKHSRAPRLHGRRGGGVRDPRSGDALADEPLRGVPGGGERHRAGGASRRRADRLGGRDPHRPVRELRRGGGPDGRAPRRSWRRSPTSSGVVAGRDRHPSLEPLAGAADHRHAALPSQRRAPALRRLAQQQLRAPRPRRDQRRGPRRPGLRLASSPPARRSWRSRPARRSTRASITHLHSARTEIFTKFFPRCGIPDAYGDWQTFEDYVARSSAPARSPSTRSSGGACGRTSRFPTVEIRIADAQPDLGEARSLAALMLRADRPDRTRARRGQSRFRFHRPGSSRRTSGARRATASPASSST